MAPSGWYPTPLPRYFAARYGLMIVYASLEPFSGWMASTPATPFLAPDLWHARAPLALFDRPYGQRLNFNVLVVWPVLASICLLCLAGQPEWEHTIQADQDGRV